MKMFSSVSLLSDPKSRSCLCSFFITASLICGAYFIGSAFLAKDYREIFSRWNTNDTRRITQSDNYQISSRREMNETRQNTRSSKCKNQCMPFGSEALPEGIVAKTSNLEMRPLWGPISDNNKSKHSVNLLAIAVGIKQKEIVNQIVEKFPANDFVVILFHYDGIVDEWSDLVWSGRVLHVSAMNQTKCYLSIVKDEGLEISQPALDPAKSEVHHQITARRRKSRVHRRYYKFKGSGRCDDNSTAPPCIGWVEMMAPVFSRAAWRCAWYMIQNDLIHAWGLDMQLGYCAQGDRTKKVGVVDSQYIVHLGLPTLGVSDENKLSVEAPEHFSQTPDASESSVSHRVDNRTEVRRQSFIEMQIFRKRWNNAIMEDKCWVDPYQ